MQQSGGDGHGTNVPIRLALESGGADAPPDQIYQRLTQAEDAEELASAWLALQCRLVEGCRRGLLLLGPPDTGPFTVAACWPPRDAPPPPSLMKAAEEALVKRAGSLDVPPAPASGDASAALLAEPVELAGSLRGVAVLELAAQSEPTLERTRLQLRIGFGWLDSVLQRRRADLEGGGKARIELVLGLVASALEQRRFSGAATAVATELAAELGCDRVSIGFIKRGHVRLRALSHSTQFGKRTNLIRAIEGAMDEAVDQRTTVVFPQPDAVLARAALAHGELARQFDARSICTVPLAHDGEPIGALTLEREEPFDARTVTLLEVVAAVGGPVLESQRRDDRFIGAKVAESAGSGLRALFGAHHVALKLITVAVVAAVAFLAVAKAPYRIAADAVLEPAEKRATVAPFDGYVASAPLRIGDTVTAGQLLASLDDRDLQLERVRWESTHAQARKQHRQALAERNAAQVEIQGAAVREAHAELERIRDRLARTQLRAPIEGVVVAGDLTQQLGAPVQRGDVLFEVAPLHRYRIHLKVPESDIAEVGLGDGGELVLSSLPNESFAFTVEKITPVSVAEEGKNTFRVEARLEDEGARLRPGVEGVGKIDVGERRLLWIGVHDIIDWLRLKLWAWTP